MNWDIGRYFDRQSFASFVCCYDAAKSPSGIAEDGDMSILSGHLLIASPYLADRNFFRSVVLIVSHDAEHAFGLLLNRPGYDPVARVWEEMTGNSYEREETVRTGGPLDGPLMVLHQVREFSDSEIVSDVHLSTVPDSVEAIVSSTKKPIIPIVGYSGWGAGQLESELEVGGWMTLPATADIIFTPPSEQWSVASRHVSDSILSGVDLRHVPQDPRWN